MENQIQTREYLTYLRQQLTYSFDSGELRTLCFDLGFDYEDLPEGGKSEKAREIVEYMERKGRIADLVKYCSDQRPHISWKRQPDNAGPSQSTIAIMGSLSALWELITKDTAAYQTVVIFQDAFHDASEEMEIIRDYKSLHDQLHTLQLSWPDNIDDECAKLPTDFRAFSSLKRLSQILRGHTGNMQDIFIRRIVRPKEREWIYELNQIQKNFEEHIDRRDSNETKNDFESVRSKLPFRLSSINKTLKDAIIGLRLDKLIREMQKVCQELSRLDRTRTFKKVEQYGDGIKALIRLEARLIELKDEHDQWQEVDNRLRMLDDLVGTLQKRSEQKGSEDLQKGKLSNLEMILLMLISKVEPLYSSKTDNWARSMKEQVASIQEAINKEDVYTAEQLFQQYRAQASYRFYDIDREMKQECDQLRGIGEMLKKVDEELEKSDEQ